MYNNLDSPAYENIGARNVILGFQAGYMITAGSNIVMILL